MAIFELEPMKHHVLICNGGTCMRHEGEEVTQAIRDEIRKQNAEAYIHTTRTRCNGRCHDAAVVIVYPQGDWYGQMTPDSGTQLVQKLVTREKLEPHLFHECTGQSSSE
ncbi:(2Fe-2S) ferredoxin domain-containing protein [Paenibacillus polymyxa]|uniref:(2Fe-2S) ferredoxin domain-containing protein n=1 Tax=Paenibacillus TaxID=44249 RepID=UPI0008461450|nr:(2Fe-2S) ferredoxin domain-containing protein [Paenibacillus polymyxa]AOK92487.1 ferredoxin [Paenibacillus polymyxa]